MKRGWYIYLKNCFALLLAFWKMGGLTRSKDQGTVGVCCQQTVCELRLGSHVECCLVPPKPVRPLTIPTWTNYVIGVAKGDFLIFFLFLLHLLPRLCKEKLSLVAWDYLITLKYNAFWKAGACFSYGMLPTPLKFQLWHSVVIWHWASHLASLGFSCLICERGWWKSCLLGLLWGVGSMPYEKQAPAICSILGSSFDQWDDNDLA